MKENKKVDTFLALVRAGLWETEVRLPAGGVDLPELLRLAQEQAVVGVVVAGLEDVPEAEVAKKDVLAFVGNALQLEQRNVAMNHFIGGLVERMRTAGILAVLVKGQGVAQCYARPLWRACGDVDFLLDEENYAKAKRFLIPLAASVDHEGAYGKHQGMSMEVGRWNSMGICVAVFPPGWTGSWTRSRRECLPEAMSVRGGTVRRRCYCRGRMRMSFLSFPVS